MDVSDRISILVISFGCWCPTLMLKDRWCRWKQRPKPSPITQSCRQHISSPTSVTNIDVVTRSHTFTPVALVRAKFFFWTSFECTFGLFDGSFFFVRLFLNIIEPHPSVKWRGYTVSVLPEAGLITVGIILTGINWGWVEGKEVWCLPLWLFFLFSASCQRLIKTLVTSRD